MGKVLFFGLAGAGKTSIYKKYFLDLPIEEVMDTTPTVLFHVSKPTAKIFGKETRVVVFDLGGQEAFIHSHLANDSIFGSLSVAIFVIDVSTSNLFDKALWFFKRAYDKICAVNEESPVMAILLHKFDSSLVSSLVPLAQQATEMFQNSIPDLSEQIYRTSVYDESLKIAMDAILEKSIIK